MARIYRRRDSPYYFADWQDLAGKRHQKSTHRKRARDAQAVADQWERESLRDPREVAAARATFRDALDLLEEHLFEEVGAERMPRATAQFHVAKAVALLRTFTGLRPLAAFDSATVRDYTAARRRGLRPLPLPPVALDRSATPTARPVGDGTIAKEIATLRLTLQLARERGLWSGDLAAITSAGLSTRYVARARVLTPAEAWALREELPRERWRVVAFALATGAELSAWPRADAADVAPDRNQVRVRGSKRTSRDRPVPVVLLACAQLLADALDGAPRTGPLFAPWPNAQRDIRAACVRAEIPHTSPNDLRRTFATWHVEAGIPLDLLFRVMGHTDTTMLARVYGRPSTERTAELMRDAIARR